jgi:hypothetical protein
LLLAPPLVIDPSLAFKWSRLARLSRMALYSMPGAMRAGFAQFPAFGQDAIDSKPISQGKLTMPVLAIGGEAAFGTMMATRCGRCARGNRSRLRSLDYGGEARSDHQTCHQLPEVVAMNVLLLPRIMAALAIEPSPTS